MLYRVEPRLNCYDWSSGLQFVAEAQSECDFSLTTQMLFWKCLMRKETTMKSILDHQIPNESDILRKEFSKYNCIGVM